MKINTLTFEDGRATVALADGTLLSILNRDRDEVLREARQWRRLPGTPFPMTRATADTFEVALATGDGDACAGPIEAPGWDAYRTGDDEWDTWVTYGYVPAGLIEAYAERVGVARGEV